jgi:hypothetical protein
MGMGEQADGNGWNMRSRKFVKRIKRRIERRKAKRNPECLPTYTKYSGYLT